jgi:hypothetical protein
MTPRPHLAQAPRPGLLNWLLVGMVALGSSCRPTAGCPPPHLTALVGLLDEPLAGLTIPCLHARDTLLEGDEGMSWPARSFYLAGRLLLIAEANWEDRVQVGRVVVVDPRIQEGPLATGQTLGMLRDHVDPVLPTVPDGYLFLTWQKDPHVHIELDISHAAMDSPLALGQVELADLPDSLRVAAIVIQ